MVQRSGHSNRALTSALLMPPCSMHGLPWRYFSSPCVPACFMRVSLNCELVCIYNVSATAQKHDPVWPIWLRAVRDVFTCNAATAAWRRHDCLSYVWNLKDTSGKILRRSDSQRQFPTAPVSIFLSLAQLRWSSQHMSLKHWLMESCSPLQVPPSLWWQLLCSSEFETYKFLSRQVVDSMCQSLIFWRIS